MFYPISLAVGLILLIISLFIFRQTLSFIKNSGRAVATVIDVVEVRDSDGSTYKPVFSFKTTTNEEIIYKPGMSSNPPSWSVGEEATIAYDLQNPHDARLLTYFHSFSWTIVLMAIAMPFIVIGGGYYVTQSFLK